MGDTDLLKLFTYVFGISALMILALNRLKIATLIGFIMTGILIGPNGFAIIPDVKSVESLAEIGIILLLFTIGTEFSLRELNRSLKPVFYGGFLQVSVAILITVPAVYLYTGNIKLAVVTGFLVSMSSTAIVLKMLQDKGDLDSPHGRAIFSILIFQDLAVILFTFVIEFMAETTFNPAILPLIVLKSLLFIGLVIFATKVLVPRLFDHIVATRSRELFIISIMLLISVTALVSAWLGLSLALGAFFAGLILADSKYSHQAVSYVIPFKDSFSGLFFISVGMFLDYQFFFKNLHLIALAVVFFMIVKVVSSTVALGAMRQHPKTTIFAGAALFQIGEFSFVIALLAKGLGLIPDFEYQMFIATSIVTMVLTPLVYGRAESISEKFLAYPFFTRFTTRHKAAPAEEIGIADHAIIIGFGVTGRNLARSLKTLGIEYAVLEMNHKTVHEYASQGERIYYGDGTHLDLLIKLGIDRARVLVIATSDPFATKKIVGICRERNKDVYVIARTKYLDGIPALKIEGATDVISEELEASMEIFSRVMNLYFVPRNLIEEQIDQIRDEAYDMAHHISEPVKHIVHAEDVLPGVEMESYFVAVDSPLVERKLEDIRLPRMTGVLVLAVKRNEIIYPNPEAHFKVKPRDTLVLAGSRAQLDDAFIYLKTGGWNPASNGLVSGTAENGKSSTS